MARLPAKKRTRAEAIQEAKTQAAMKLLTGRYPDARAREYLDENGMGDEVAAIGDWKELPLVKRLLGVDQHAVIWPQDAVRVGRILAAVYLRCMVPENIRRQGVRSELDPHSIGEYIFFPLYKAFPFLLKFGAKTLVKDWRVKLFTFVMDKVSQGAAGINDLIQIIVKARLIQPLTGKVFDDEYIQIKHVTDEFFIGLVIALMRYLARSHNARRVFKDHVYHRTGRKTSISKRLSDLMKQLGLPVE